MAMASLQPIKSALLTPVFLYDTGSKSRGLSLLKAQKWAGKLVGLDKGRTVVVAKIFKNQRLNFKIALFCSASAALMASPVAAQTESTEAEVADSSENEIIVTGIRGSLQKAAGIKKDSAQIVDVITAEDVGKLPDANVAEALQRVTGVQITRVFGEGQAVSVRGLQQVRVEVDGRTLLGWSARLSPPENDQLGRSSGLDSVPAGLFGRLEVRKTPLASQAEGGLGGTVNLVTPKPFDFKKNQLSLRAQATFSDVTGKIEPAFTGLFSRKFADGRFGFLLAAEYQKRTSTIQSFERNNFVTRRLVPAASATTNPTVAGVSTNAAATNVLAPILLQYENFVVDRSRFGVNGSLQFEVTPEFTITAESIFSKLETNRRQDFLAWRLPAPAATAANQLIISNPTIVDGIVAAGNASGTLTTAGQLRNEPTESYLYALNGAYDNGKLKIVADGYYSKGTIDQTIDIITLQGTAAVPGRFDFQNGEIPGLFLGTQATATTAANPYNPNLFSNFNLANNGIRSNRLIGLLEEWTGKVDLSYELDSGITVFAGARYVDLHARSNAYRSQVGSATSPARTVIQPFTASVRPSDFLSEINGSFPTSFLSTVPTTEFVFTTAQAAQPNPNANDRSTLLPNIQRDYDFNEKTLSGYLMFQAEGEVFGIPTKANAGVRVSSTKLDVDSFRGVGTVFTPQNNKNKFTNILPSANVTFNVTDDFLIRISGSQTMQRASIQDLSPSTFFNQTNLTVTTGDANLDAPIATQGDISFEYYTGRSSLISGAVFYKDISNFITTVNELVSRPQFSTSLVQEIRPVNIPNAKVKGFEIGVQQFLDFLPSPLDGLGFIANYTYSDSEDSFGFPLVAVSKNSYNLVALYEKGPVSARVAYNYRDDSLFEFTLESGGVRIPNNIGKRSQLDAQIGFDITDNFALQFQAQNLIPKDSATVEYTGTNPLALNSYALSERRLSAGVRLKF
jgi:iron complex outermembrane recepter protein